MATGRSLAGWKRNAIRQIVASRKASQAFFKTLPPAEARRPRTIDEWSAKDVVGHLLACDEETIRRFRLIAQGRGDKIFWFRSMDDADRFNARTVAATR